MAQEPARPSPRRPDETTTDRLDSWKDVAAYVQRDVSTVQRWEKREAMPVHRHVHEKQGTEHGLRAASTEEARGGVGLSATGVTKVPERLERQLAGDGSPAACAIRPDRRHK